MQESEHNLRLEIAKVLESRGTHVSRELARNSPREIDIVQDGHFYHLAVNEKGELSIDERPPQKKIFGKILLGLGCFAVFGAFCLFVADYINLKMAKPAPIVLAARAAGPAPVVLGSTQPKTAPLLAPLPAIEPPPKAAPTPDATLAAVPTQKGVTMPGSQPGTVIRQIPLSRGFGTVQEDDTSSKFQIKPNTGE